jgi:hypothetical protein
MSMHDASDEEMHDERSPAVVSVKVEKLDTLHAAAKVMAALKAGDASELNDALKLWCVAYDDENGQYEHEEPDGDEE